jgi:Ca2+-binding EF-hand superfamily protein
MVHHKEGRVRKAFTTLAVVAALGIGAGLAGAQTKAASSNADDAQAKFKAADKNGDGFLDEAELKTEAGVMRGGKDAAEGNEAHFAKVKKMIMEADGNKDGKISKDEYAAWGSKAETVTGKIAPKK